jgi:hypothetical protein
VGAWAGAVSEPEVVPVLDGGVDAAAAAGDAMVWTIAGAPAAIELRATLRIDGETIAPCVARVDRPDPP